MDNNTKAATNNKSNDTTKQEQTSTLANNLLACRRTKMHMVQNVLFICLDDTIDNKIINSDDKIKQVQYVINTIETFTDVDQCIDYLTDLSNQKVCMIISCETSTKIMSLIDDISQLYTIFIFCQNNTQHQHQYCPKTYGKVKDIYTDISSMCEALQKTARQCEQNSVSISFVSTTDDLSKKKLDQIEPSFMYTQIIKEILLSIQFEQKQFHQFIDYCREMLSDNANLVEHVEILKETYRKEKAIWWYTYESFLYSMLNRALRTLDTDLIIIVGFFIKDLHLQIEQLHNTQFSDRDSQKSFIVYRGQGMSKDEFEKLMKTKSGLLSFNCFLSTSRNRNVSSLFAESAADDPNLVGILFAMTINLSQSTTVFAAIGDVSYYKDEEEEVLFSMHTVFRLNNIISIDENQRIFQIDLILTSDNDTDLHTLTTQIRKETFPHLEGWRRLGLALLKMGQSKNPKEVYEMLLERETTQTGKADIYHQIGWAKFNQGEYKEAIKYYEKAVAIEQQSLPSNHPDLAVSYVNIGTVYNEMGEYFKAISYYEKALAIQQQPLPANHRDLAASYDNIGTVYLRTGEYSKALSYYEKGLAIKQSLPPNHPDLALSYSNIGLVYHKIAEYSKALPYYEKALAIQQQSLPSNHPHLCLSYNNIGSMYGNIHEYSKALSCYEKALAIQQQSLSSYHPHLSMSYNNIGTVYFNTNEYFKALSYYEKALAVQQQSLPSNHLNLAATYSDMGAVYFKMGEYFKAASSYEKALVIQQQSLPSNHPDLASSYKNIGVVYLKMCEYSKALPYYEKALAIQQQSLHPNHPDLAAPYSNIGSVYFKMNEYAKALLSYEKALVIQQQSLPSNHPDLVASYSTISNVSRKMGKYSEARSFLERAVQIAKRSLSSNHPLRIMLENNLVLMQELVNRI